MNVLRIKSDRLGEVQEIIKYLNTIENAYNNIYAFDLIVKEVELKYPDSGEGSWRHIRPARRPRGLRKIKQVANVVIPEDKLRIRSIVIQSPGFWEFVGSLNPLEVMRKYVNDRHERKKDIDYRNKLEAERMSLENEKLKSEVVRDKLEILRSINIPEDRIRDILFTHVVNPLKNIDGIQDSGLFADAEVIEVKNDNIDHPKE